MSDLQKCSTDGCISLVDSRYKTICDKCDDKRVLDEAKELAEDNVVAKAKQMARVEDLQVKIKENLSKEEKPFSLDGATISKDKMDKINENINKNRVRTFESGSRRDTNEHKPRIADLKAYTRKRFGYHMLIGAKNYGTGNFEKGQPDESSLESIHRHLADFELGDRSECHLSAIIFGIQLIMLNEQKDGVFPNFYYEKYLSCS